MTFDPDWLRATWHTDGVCSVMTTRHGGTSEGRYASMNLRDGLGDAAGAVRENQARLAAATGATPVWLNQVHGCRVVRLTRADAAAGAEVHEADASVTTDVGIACTVQVADCLPVLFAAPGAVAAAHAGWRGLAAGVLEATLDGVCAAAGCEPGAVEAWLGPCIGPRQFEVGLDVLGAFGRDGTFNRTDAAASHFMPTRPGKWLADLPGLARDRLLACGVSAISGGSWCTVSDASRFYSFRRDGATGRMAAVIWRVV